jgi:hypothetical protein
MLIVVRCPAGLSVAAPTVKALVLSVALGATLLILTAIGLKLIVTVGAAPDFSGLETAQTKLGACHETKQPIKTATKSNKKNNPTFHRITLFP